MLHIFLVPSTVCLAILIPYGIRSAVDFCGARRGPPGSARIMVGILLPVTAMVLPHFLRVHAYAHPIGPLRWRMKESCPPRLESLVPSLQGFTEARTYGEEVLSMVPEGAMIIGYRDEIMPLYYFRYVENMRTDIVLDSFYPEHLSLLQSWQDTHEVSQRPFVFLDRIPQVWNHVVELDSLQLANGRLLYVHRGRLSFE